MKPISLSRIQCQRIGWARFSTVCAILCGLAWHQANSLASAEEWSDVTGKFRVEAEYVGVQGREVVLKKSDGSTLRVPIAKLSTESRSLAKEHYDQQRRSAKQPDAKASRSAAPLVASPPNRAINFTPPVPSATQPMAAFPSDPSLQETSDFVIDQILAGHPEVVWEALPQEIRDRLDDPGFRSAVDGLEEATSAEGDTMLDISTQILGVLISKQDFVLNSALLSRLPPEILPTVRQGYDPAMGLAYEIIMLPKDMKAVMKRPISELIMERGPRIGAHLHALAHAAPAGMIDQFRSQITVTQSDETHGTITAPDGEGGTQTTAMVKIDGRWLPQGFAERWNEKKETLREDFVASVKMLNESSEKSAAKLGGSLQSFNTLAHSITEPLAKAKTQAEFDQALMQAIFAIGSLTQ